jgi:hypothetical protein
MLDSMKRAAPPPRLRDAVLWVLALALAATIHACGTGNVGGAGGGSSGGAGGGSTGGAGGGGTSAAGGGSTSGAGGGGASTVDGGSEDAGAPDAGAFDAGLPDAGTSDAGTPDAGSADAGCGTGAQTCGGPADCAPTGTLCLDLTCSAACCGTTPAPARTACGDHGGTLCDSSGHCLTCLTSTDCSPTGTVCATPACDLGACQQTVAPLGTPCSENSGVVCDGHGQCTGQHCADGLTDADETDVDCGGASCSACAVGRRCVAATDCHSGLCGVGVCVACTSDTDCQATQWCDLANAGGTCSPRRAQGSTCTTNTQCASLHCADNFCCGSACNNSLCVTCNGAFMGTVPGLCGNVPPGQNNPDHPCGSGLTCDGAGACH